MLLCENVETTNVMGKIPLGGNVFGFYTVWFLRPRKFLFLFLFVCLFLSKPLLGPLLRWVGVVVRTTNSLAACSLSVCYLEWRGFSLCDLWPWNSEVSQQDGPMFALQIS